MRAMDFADYPTLPEDPMERGGKNLLRNGGLACLSILGLAPFKELD